MKLNISLILLFSFITSTALAQLYCPPIYGKRNEGKYHVALGVGPTLMYGDIEKANTSGFAFYLAGDYTVTRGVDVGLELQLGTLKAIGEELDNRFVTNRYQAGGVMVKVFPFRLFTEKKFQKASFVSSLKESFYVGAGMLGVINNYAKQDIYREANLLSMDYDTPNYTWGPVERDGEGNLLISEDNEQQFKERINSLTLPTLNVGLAIPVNQLTSNSGRFWSVMLNGQFNFSNNDLLDGYMPYQSGTGNRVGLKNDFYSFYTLGIRYSL